MMEKSIFDMTVDILVERGKDARNILVERFKKTKPFRMEPMSDKDMVDNYRKIKADPMLEQEIRQALGEAEFEQMEFNMHELINRRMQDA